MSDVDRDGPAPVPAGGVDAQVLERVAGGDVDALAELYDRYRALAYAIALRITNNTAAAEDVVQEAFMGAWRNAAAYDPGRATVKTWLLAIVHHRAIDAVRRRRPTVELVESEERMPAALTLEGPWLEVAGRLDAAEIRGALEALPGAQREAIELAYFGGLTQQQIATRTGQPLGTVKGRVRLGLTALRRLLLDDREGALRSDTVASVGSEVRQ